MCKVRLGCHDDVQSDVVCKAWVGGFCFSAWIDVSGLMGSYLMCVLHMSRLYRLCG